MAGIDKRIADLERLIVAPEDEGAELRRAVIRDILDELAALKSCRARNSYRGGNPPTPIQPTDPAGDALGYPYTTGELVGFRRPPGLRAGARDRAREPGRGGCGGDGRKLYREHAQVGLRGAVGGDRGRGASRAYATVALAQPPGL